ncbi:asparagine synthase [Candidatus Halobonum tyrrellensis G22]|uniref:Putative asparagine synthetase [glutamine-hydrolyzing] n=2 Tax=Candidatus Halobonum TaxID=1431544 RepID=V4HQ13_9EURY|nr:asparagine synthase [Candidatus Halobonum tyrrellensis G22]
MLDAIDHRGPDGRGAWCDDAVALGHQQLRTTPESAFDDQPYREDGLVVVSDARLDNRGELLETLDVPDPGHPIPDSRLLLAAYREWGDACVDHLIGAFAFAIWDADDGSVFCGRDRFGVKPLYYYEGADAFAVATELKALLTLPFVSRTVDETKVGDFLVGLFDDKERTYYRDLSRLPPAHAARVRLDGSDRWQYWDLDPTRTVTLGSDAAYERRFRELFDQAVDCRLRASGTVGTALSGGLDSSSITVTAREFLRTDQPLHAFSNVYDDAPAADERDFIETVTQREGIVPHYVFLDDVGSFGDRERMMQHYDVPPHDTMHHAIWERAKRADETGVDVLLEGALGDSATGYGLGLLGELLRTGRWWQLFTQIQAMSEVGGARRHRLFLSNAVEPLLPPPVRRVRRRLRGEPVLNDRENPTLNPEFAERSGIRERLKGRESNTAFLTETGRRRQYRSLLSGMITASLETTDLATAAFDVEPWYPFTDKRLVEFSLAIPPSQQLSDGWTRSIIRRSLRGRLPEKIRRRPWKTDMSQGFWNSLSREDERLRRLVADPGPVEAYIDPTALQEAYDRFVGSNDTRDARSLWRALSLSVWVDAYEPEKRDSAR